MRFTFSLLCFFLAASACEYRETVGREGQDNSGNDASVGCDGASCDAPVDCSTFMAPASDCTLGLGDCTFDRDCMGLNQNCNRATRRCFAGDAVCVGTPCSLDLDCPASERCNLIANSCFELAADQSCMPCFLLSEDCGTQTCDTDLNICI